ncbi:DUF58 domain-containing protein [Psychrosphaera aestuarii]|uniref:DUF58 domain-containing protein n=1 Tax=Psychrosphaera aestuarii TaxID=1266052 RepID=UPI001FD40869|nr:DUF58 domain-containing protein [Psychrosphaera aestuarii]
MMTVNAHLEWMNTNGISGVQCELDELLMYQRYIHLLNTKPSSNVKHHLSGQYLAKTKGRGMEFDEARHYQPGDDVRTIDWRVTARTGKTHTKIFREEKDRPIFILCDLLPTMYFGSELLFKSVQACHLASLIAWKAKKNGDKVGGLVLTKQQLFESKPRARQQALLHWLNQLVQGHQTLSNKKGGSASPSGSADSLKSLPQHFENACKHLRQVAHPGSLIYIISDFQNMSEQALQHLFQLQKHCEVNACAIYDPIEQALPHYAGNNLAITDGNKVKVISSATQIAQYNDNAQKRFFTQKQHLQQFNIKWLPISAGLPLHEQL